MGWRFEPAVLRDARCTRWTKVCVWLARVAAECDRAPARRPSLAQRGALLPSLSSHLPVCPPAHVASPRLLPSNPPAAASNPPACSPRLLLACPAPCCLASSPVLPPCRRSTTVLPSPLRSLYLFKGADGVASSAPSREASVARLALLTAPRDSQLGLGARLAACVVRCAPPQIKDDGSSVWLYDSIPARPWPWQALLVASPRRRSACRVAGGRADGRAQARTLHAHRGACGCKVLVNGVV